MNQIETKEPFTHWYQEPWVWFIIGIIVVTVSWGTYRVIFAFQHADEVVVDDYYKVGKAINQDLSRDRRAAQQHIQAVITVNAQTHALKVAMDGNTSDWPQQLRLRIMPTARDTAPQTIALLQTPHQATLYSGQSQGIADGRYYVQLETLDEITPEQGYLSGWRLNREVVFQTGMPVQLSARP